jgi:hypothetical protein
MDKYCAGGGYLGVIVDYECEVGHCFVAAVCRDLEVYRVLVDWGVDIVYAGVVVG